MKQIYVMFIYSYFATLAAIYLAGLAAPLIAPHTVPVFLRAFLVFLLTVLIASMIIAIAKTTKARDEGGWLQYRPKTHTLVSLYYSVIIVTILIVIIGIIYYSIKTYINIVYLYRGY